jgi:hypothetical protein
MDGYLAIVLDHDSQKKLLEKFPPSHPKVFAHHVTVAFRPTTEEFDMFKKYIGTVVSLNVRGYAKDEKGEAVVVDTEILKDRLNHITISTNRIAPYYSKNLLEKGYTPLTEPFELQGTFEFIKH